MQKIKTIKEYFVSFLKFIDDDTYNMKRDSMYTIMSPVHNSYRIQDCCIYNKNNPEQNKNLTTNTLNQIVFLKR